MQVLVVYHSRSGSTKKIAEAIVRGVEEVAGVAAVMKTASEATPDDFVAAAGVISGSPAYFGSMAAELKTLFDKLVPVRSKLANKVGAAFASSGDPSGGRETTMLSILQALMICGMVVVGDPLDASGHYGVSSIGDPDRVTLAHAGKLGARVAGLVKKLADA